MNPANNPPPIFRRGDRVIVSAPECTCPVGTVVDAEISEGILKIGVIHDGGYFNPAFALPAGYLLVSYWPFSIVQKFD